MDMNKNLFSDISFSSQKYTLLFLRLESHSNFPPWVINFKRQTAILIEHFKFNMEGVLLSPSCKQHIKIYIKLSIYRQRKSSIDGHKKATSMKNL